MLNRYPVGTIVASAKMAYIKKEDYIDGDYWIGTEGYAYPFYGDSQVNQWIADGTHKVVRLGTDG
jgi:hypothetical protein